MQTIHTPYRSNATSGVQGAQSTGDTQLTVQTAASTLKLGKRTPSQDDAAAGTLSIAYERGSIQVPSYDRTEVSGAYISVPGKRHQHVPREVIAVAMKTKISGLKRISAPRLSKVKGKIERTYEFARTGSKKEIALIVTLQNKNFSGPESVHYVVKPGTGC